MRRARFAARPSPNNMFKSHLMTVLALAFTIHLLHAEPAVVITLSSVGDRIRAQNPNLAAARLRIQEAIGRMNQSGRLANPELEAGVDHNPNFHEGKFEIGVSQRFPVTDRLKLEKDVSVTELQSAEAEVRLDLTGPRDTDGDGIADRDDLDDDNDGLSDVDEIAPRTGFTAG